MELDGEQGSCEGGWWGGGVSIRNDSLKGERVKSRLILQLYRDVIFKSRFWNEARIIGICRL